MLYIVATPIGNLEDLSARALRILKEVDAIVAEDTRRTQILLKHFGISKPIFSYFEYSKSDKLNWILKKLEDGDSLAYVTDGGTPGISDPGVRLVGAAYTHGISVTPIPGPSAIVSALSVAGLPTEPFHFWGFLSPKRSKRRRIYETIQTLHGTHGFYESPHRLLKRLEEWKEFFLDYQFFVAKEISKKFETTWRGTLEDVFQEISKTEVRGEFTVLFSKEEL